MSKESVTNGHDLISRQAAIDIVNKNRDSVFHDSVQYEDAVYDISNLPSAQPEIKPIEYRDCANAMLRMWMDNVVTDGEYNRIMGKLNAHWGMENGRFNQPSGGN